MPIARDYRLSFTSQRVKNELVIWKLLGSLQLTDRYLTFQLFRHCI